MQEITSSYHNQSVAHSIIRRVWSYYSVTSNKTRRPQLNNINITHTCLPKN